MTRQQLGLLRRVGKVVWHTSSSPISRYTSSLKL
jgi:hypothetical protein